MTKYRIIKKCSEANGCEYIPQYLSKTTYSNFIKNGGVITTAIDIFTFGYFFRLWKKEQWDNITTMKYDSKQRAKERIEEYIERQNFIKEYDESRKETIKIYPYNPENEKE